MTTRTSTAASAMAVDAVADRFDARCIPAIAAFIGVSVIITGAAPATPAAA